MGALCRIRDRERFRRLIADVMAPDEGRLHMMLFER